MKIIKPGDPEKTLCHKNFTCLKCGCEFIADSTEYEHAGMQYNIQYYRCKCPCCGTLIYMDEHSTRGVYDFSYAP